MIFECREGHKPIHSLSLLCVCEPCIENFLFVELILSYDIEVQTLVDLGYSEEACAEALQRSDGSVEAAAEYLSQNAAALESQMSSGEEAPTGDLRRLMDLGYTRAVCEAAMEGADDDIERAGEWLLVNAEEWMRQFNLLQSEGDSSNGNSRNSGGWGDRSGSSSSSGNPFRRVMLGNVHPSQASRNAKMYCSIFADIAESAIRDCERLYEQLSTMVESAKENPTQARWLLCCIQSSILGSTAREIMVAIWTVCSRLSSRPKFCLRMIPRLKSLLEQHRSFVEKVVTQVKDSNHPLVDVVRWLHSRFAVITARVASMMCGHLTFSLPLTSIEGSPATTSWIHCTLLKGGIRSGVIPELQSILDESLLGSRPSYARKEGELKQQPEVRERKGSGTSTTSFDDDDAIDHEANNFLQLICEEKSLGMILLKEIRRNFRPVILPGSVKRVSEPICRLAFAAILRHTRMIEPALYVARTLERMDREQGKQEKKPLEGKCKLVLKILVEWWSRVRRIKMELGRAKGEGANMDNLCEQYRERLRLLLELQPPPAVRAIPFFNNSERKEMGVSPGMLDEEFDDDDDLLSPMRLARSGSSKWRKADHKKSFHQSALAWAKKEIVRRQLLTVSVADQACSSAENVCEDILSILSAVPERFGSKSVRQVMLIQRSRALLRLQGLRYFQSLLTCFVQFPQISAPTRSPEPFVSEKIHPPLSRGERVLVRTKGFQNHVCYLEGAVSSCVPVGRTGWELRVRAPLSDQKEKAFPYPPSNDEYLVCPRHTLEPKVGSRVFIPIQDEKTPDKWAWYAGSVSEWRRNQAKVNVGDGTSWEIRYPSPHRGRLAPDGGGLDLDFIQKIDLVDTPLIVIPKDMAWPEGKRRDAPGEYGMLDVDESSRVVQSESTAVVLMNQALYHLARVFCLSSGNSSSKLANSASSLSSSLAARESARNSRSNSGSSPDALVRNRTFPHHYLTSVECAGPKLTRALGDSYFGIISFMFNLDRTSKGSSVVMKRCTIELCSILEPCDLGHIQSIGFVSRLSKLASMRGSAQSSKKTKALEPVPRPKRKEKKEKEKKVRTSNTDDTDDDKDDAATSDGKGEGLGSGILYPAGEQEIYVQIAAWLLFRLVSYMAFDNASEYPVLCKTILDVIHSRVESLTRARKKVIDENRALNRVLEAPKPKSVKELCSLIGLDRFAFTFEDKGYEVDDLLEMDDRDTLLELKNVCNMLETEFDWFTRVVAARRAHLLRAKKHVAVDEKLGSVSSSRSRNHDEKTQQPLDRKKFAKGSHPPRNKHPRGVGPEEGGVPTAKFHVGQQVVYYSRPKRRWCDAMIRRFNPDDTVVIALKETVLEKTGVLGKSVRAKGSGPPDDHELLDDDDIEPNAAGGDDYPLWSDMALSDCSISWYKHINDRKWRVSLKTGMMIEVLNDHGDWKEAILISKLPSDINVRFLHSGVKEWVSISSDRIRVAKHARYLTDSGSISSFASEGNDQQRGQRQDSLSAGGSPSTAAGNSANTNFIKVGSSSSDKDSGEELHKNELTAAELELQLCQQLWVLVRAVKSEKMATAIASPRWLNILLPIVMEGFAPNSSVSILVTRVLRKALPYTQPNGTSLLYSSQQLLQSMFDRIFTGVALATHTHTSSLWRLRSYSRTTPR
eukprot:jgi/Bigna1/141141/aug1.60_g15849